MTRLIGLLIVLLAAPAAPAVGAAEAVIDAELWDPNSGEFTTTGSLADTRFCHGATLLDAGHVLIAGGRSGTGDGRYTTTAEAWDPDLGHFRAAGALLEPRCWPGVVTLPDGRVLVVGGSYGSGDDGMVHASAEIWDPLTERFEPTGSMADGRGGHTTTLLPDGRVLVVGGVDASGD